jgi:hypothetical protein
MEEISSVSETRSRRARSPVRHILIVILEHLVAQTVSFTSEGLLPADFWTTFLGLLATLRICVGSSKSWPIF